MQILGPDRLNNYAKMLRCNAISCEFCIFFVWPGDGTEDFQGKLPLSTAGRQNPICNESDVKPAEGLSYLFD